MSEKLPTVPIGDEHVDGLHTTFNPQGKGGGIDYGKARHDLVNSGTMTYVKALGLTNVEIRRLVEESKIKKPETATDPEAEGATHETSPHTRVIEAVAGAIDGHEGKITALEKEVTRLSEQVQKLLELAKNLRGAPTEQPEPTQAEGSPGEGVETVDGAAVKNNSQLDQLPGAEAGKEGNDEKQRLIDYKNALDALNKAKAATYAGEAVQNIDELHREFEEAANRLGSELVKEHAVDEATQQGMIAAIIARKWEDKNREDGKGPTNRFVRCLAKMNPIARSLVFGAVGAGVGAVAVATGHNVNELTGSAFAATGAAITTVGAWRVGRAFAGAEIAVSPENTERKRGKLEQWFNTTANKVIGLTPLPALYERSKRRQQARYNKRLQEAYEAIDQRSEVEGWSEKEIVQKKAQAIQEADKWKRRKQRTAVFRNNLIATGIGGLAGAAVVGEIFDGASGIRLPSAVPAEEARGTVGGDGGTIDETTPSGADKTPVVGARQKLERDDMQPETTLTHEDAAGLDTADPGNYTAENIGGINYADYLSPDKVSNYAMGTGLDMSSADAAAEGMFDQARTDPSYAAQMVIGYLSDQQMEALGLGDMAPRQVAEALRDPGLRAAALNEVDASLTVGVTKVEIVKGVSGHFINWGAKPIGADGQPMSFEDALETPPETTKLVQSTKELEDAKLLRVTDGNGNNTYYSADCENLLTEKPVKGVPVETDHSRTVGSTAAVSRPHTPVDEAPSTPEQTPPAPKPEQPTPPEEPEQPTPPPQPGPETPPVEDTPDAPKSDNPDDYEHQEGAPPAKVDPGQGEKNAPQDNDNSITDKDNKPREEIPRDREGGAPDDATPVDPGDRENEVNNTPPERQAPSPDKPGGEVPDPRRNGGGSQEAIERAVPAPAPERAAAPSVERQAPTTRVAVSTAPEPAATRTSAVGSVTSEATTHNTATTKPTSAAQPAAAEAAEAAAADS